MVVLVLVALLGVLVDEEGSTAEVMAVTVSMEAEEGEEEA
jgi:hypothetical protein